MTVLKAKATHNLLCQPYDPTTKILMTFEDHYNLVMMGYHNNQVRHGNISTDRVGHGNISTDQVGHGNISTDQVVDIKIDEEIDEFGGDDLNDPNCINVDDNLFQSGDVSGPSIPMF